MATMTSLLVEVGADIGKFVSGMTKMEAVARKQTSAMAKEFKSMAGTVGVALSTAMFVGMGKGAIDAMDRLEDLRKTTNLTVETLTGLSHAATLNGSDLETVSGAVNKLALNMGKYEDKFRALGITAKDPLEALKQMADVFVSIEDPQLRAATMTEAFGRSWERIAPLLAGGSAEITKLIEEGQKYSGVTTEMAAQASEFNDKWDTLTKSGILLNSTVGGLLPLLNVLADDMISSATSARDATKDWSLLSEIGKVITIVVGNVGYVLKMMGREIGGIAAQIVAFMSGDFSGAADIGERMKQEAEDARAAFDAWEKKVMDAGAASTAAAPAIDGVGKAADGAGKRISEAAKRFINFNKGQQEAEAFAKELEGAMARLIGKSTGFTADFGKTVETLNKGLAAGKITAEEHEAAMKALVELQPRYLDGMKAEIDAAKARNDEVEAFLDLEEQARKATEDIIKGVRQEAESLELEVRMAGMSNAQRAKTIALLKLQASGAQVSAEAMESLANRVYESVTALEGIERTKSMWGELSDFATNFGMALLEGPAKALDYLRQSAKRFLLDMIAIFMKRWVLQLGAGLTGSASLGAMAGEVGANTLTGAAASGLGNLLGIPSASSLGSSFMTGWNAVTMAGEAGAPAMGAGGIMGGVGEFAAQAWQWAAANPVTAVAAVVIIAALAISRMRRGGPKPGGSFFGGFDAEGNFTGTSAVPGTDNGRFFTPNDQDAAMEQMTRQFASGFFGTLSRLGGTTSGLSFGLGTDQDPRGSAASRVAGAIYQDGMEVFRSMVEAGRDDEDLQRAFGLTMSRMMLAGLQASNLPEGVAAILNSVSAQTGSQEQIQAVIDLAIAFGDLMTVVTSPFTAGGVIEEATRSATSRFRMNGEALVTLASKTNLTTEELQRLTQATAEYRTQAAQLILTFEALRQSVTDTIDGLIAQTALAGMDPQQQFEYWQNQANSLFAQMMASTDPAEIERLMGQFTTAWSNAWSLLSPEQQASEGAEWGRRLTTARTMINEHIQSLIDGVVEDTNDTLAIVGDKMNEAALKLDAAADKQVVAAGTFAGAVDKGIRVSIILDQYGSAIVTEGG